MFFLSSRAVIKLEGNSVLNFLEGLVTASVKGLEDGFCFTAMLNAKGRFLFDFFAYRSQNNVFIDIHQNWVEGLIKALKFYDLLNEIKLTKTNLKVYVDENFLKKWHMGKFEGRFLKEESLQGCLSEEAFHEERIKLCLPDGFFELKQEKSIILDFGYDEAKGISFEKGCYTGQELMMRTKRLGEVRKALFCIFAPQISPQNVLSKFGNYALLQGYKNEFDGEVEGKKYEIISSSDKNFIKV